MDSNLLTSYYFLAALAENNTDIYDSVYVPLCKRCLFRISADKNEGTHLDVQKKLHDDYGLDVPEDIVRQLLVRISNQLSMRERRAYGFNLMDKGRCFQFNEFSYNKMENTYNSIRRGAGALEEAFQDFVKAQGQEPTIPFQNFIDANKHKLSSFFSNKSEDPDVEEEYLLHAKFLRKIEYSHHELYKAAEKAYLGSIIAAYLESGVNVEAKQDSGVVYYLDTRVLFEILDLQDPESTKPARDLLGLIKNTGGKPRVLSITITEMTEILKRELSLYDLKNPTTTIGDACKRRQLKKTLLVNLQAKLADELKKQHEIELDTLSETKIQQYRDSSDVAKLVATGYAPSNARHDVSAYLCVRERRSIQTLLQKQSYWFVTANKRLCAFNEKHKTGSFPEIILSSELTSLLFLRNPKQYASLVSSRGLSALIALTLTEEFADRDLINQFDSAVREKVDVTEEDYNLLLNYLATESTKRINNLIDNVRNNSADVASQHVHEMVNKARAEKEKDSQTMREVEDEKDKAVQERRKQEEINAELERRLTESEQKWTSAIEKLDSQEQDIDRLKKINRRWLFVLISIVVVVACYFFLQIDGLCDWLDKALKGVMGLSGLWGFGNFVLNLWGKIKK